MDNYLKIMDNITVQIDPRLDEYNDKILFPKKVEKAKMVISNIELPQKKSKSKPKPKQHTLLQRELLTFYALEPTTQQMQELKEFMFKLFEKRLVELTH